MADKSCRKSSILKTPKKPRTPLQDVNTLNVNPCDEEDEECEGEMTSTTSHTAALRRRVSFAGTNMVKEFYSESECASVWHGPAYEEPLTMSSDSSGAPSDWSSRTSILFQQSQHTLQTSTISTQATSINKVSVREEDPCEAILRQFGCQTGLSSSASKQPVRKARFSLGDPEPSNTEPSNGGDVLMEILSQEQFRPSETENSSISHHHQIPSVAQSVEGSSVPATQITVMSSKTVCLQSSYITGSSNQISCDNFEMNSTSTLSYVTDRGTLNEPSESSRGKATNSKDIEKENSPHESVKIKQCNQNIPNNSQPEASSSFSRQGNVLQGQCNKTFTSSQKWMTQHQSGSLDQMKYDINTSRPVPTSAPEISSVNDGVDKESLTLAEHDISDSALAPVIAAVSTKKSLNQSNYNDVEIDFTNSVPSSILAPVLSTLKAPEGSNELPIQTKYGNSSMEYTKQSSRLSLAPVVNAVKVKEVSMNALNQANYDHEEMNFMMPINSHTAHAASALNDPEEMNFTKPINSHTAHTASTPNDPEGIKKTLDQRKDDAVKRDSLSRPAALLKTSDDSRMSLHETRFDGVEMDFTTPLPSSISFPTFSHAEDLQATTEVSKYCTEPAAVAGGCDSERAECSNFEEHNAESDTRSVSMELTKAANENTGSKFEHIFNPGSSANADKTCFPDESMEFTKCLTLHIDCPEPNLSPKVSSHAFQIKREPLSNASQSKISSSKHSEIILDIQPTTFPGIEEEHENMVPLATEGVLKSRINVSDLNVPISSQSSNDALFVRNENQSFSLLKNTSQSSPSKLQNTCFVDGSFASVNTNSEKTQVFDESMEFTEVLPGNIQEEFLRKSDDSATVSGKENGHEHAFPSSSSGTAANCIKMIENKCGELSGGVQVHTEQTEHYVTHIKTVACSSTTGIQPDINIVLCSNESVLVEEHQMLEPSSSKDHPLNPNYVSHSALQLSTDLPDDKLVQEECFMSNGNIENSKDCSPRHTSTNYSGVKRDSTGRAASPYKVTQSQDHDCEGTSELLEAGCNPSKRLCTSGSVNCHKDYEKDAVENATLVVPSSRSPSPERSLYDTIPALSPELWKVKSQPANSLKADFKNTGSKSYCEENDNFAEHLCLHSSLATSSSNGDQQQVFLTSDHTSSSEVSQLLVSADSNPFDSGIENGAKSHGDTAHTPSNTEVCKIHTPPSTACNHRAEGCEKEESFSSNGNISKLADANKIEECQATEVTQKDNTQVPEHEVANKCNSDRNSCEINIFRRMSPGYTLEDEVDIMNESFPSQGSHSSLETTGIEDDLLHQSIAVSSKNVEKMFQQSLVLAKQHLNASSQNLHSVDSSGGLPRHTSSNDLSRQNCAAFHVDESILDVKDCSQSTTAALKFDNAPVKSPEKSCLGASPRALVVPNISSQFSFRISPQKTIRPLYISEEKPRPVEELIHEYETKDDCLWTAHKESDYLWLFSFNCLHLDLKVHLESPTVPSNFISGKNAAFVCKLSESNKPILHWGRRILMSKLSTKEFRTELCWTSDFMGLLRKISIIVAENRKFLLDLIRLEGTKGFKISGDSLTFDVINFTCQLWFIVKMKLDCWENYTPAHVSIENRLGDARESEVQELVCGVTKDVKFFTNYYNDIMEYVATLEALHQKSRPTT